MCPCLERCCFRLVDECVLTYKRRTLRRGAGENLCLQTFRKIVGHRGHVDSGTRMQVPRGSMCCARLLAQQEVKVAGDAFLVFLELLPYANRIATSSGCSSNTKISAQKNPSRLLLKHRRRRKANYQRRSAMHVTCSSSTKHLRPSTTHVYMLESLFHC